MDAVYFAVPSLRVCQVMRQQLGRLLQLLIASADKLCTARQRCSETAADAASYSALSEQASQPAEFISIFSVLYSGTKPSAFSREKFARENRSTSYICEGFRVAHEAGISNRQLRLIRLLPMMRHLGPLISTTKIFIVR
jgi:hypothetical protein